MSSNGVNRRHSKSLGRSGPRSKFGCQTCKLRRVRCDEARPICSHCTRLDLDCVYQPPISRRRKSTSTSRRDHISPTASLSETGVEDTQHSQHTQTPPAQADDILPQATNGVASALMDGTQDRQHVHRQYQHQHHVSQELSHAGTTSPGFGSRCQQTIIGSAASEPADALQMDSVVSMVGLSGASGVGGGDKSYAWQDGYLERFTDYHPVPDPPFTFISLAFENSPNMGELDHQQQPNIETTTNAPGGDTSQSWFGNLAENQMFPTHPESSSAVMVQPLGDVSSTNHTVVQERSNSSTNIESEMQSLANLSAPTLSITQKEMLLNHFERDIRPPASLAGVDPLGWTKIKPYVLRKARGQSEFVTQPLYALTALLSSIELPFQSSINRYNYKLVAVHMQQSACRCLQMQLLQDDWMNRSQDLLIAVFLLAWFEIAYDDDDRDRPPFPSESAEKILLNGQGWSEGSKHLLQWLTLLDSKISHLGGPNLFSETALGAIRQGRTDACRPKVSEVDDSDDLNSLSGTASTRGPGDVNPAPSSKLDHRSKLGHLLTCRTEAPRLPHDVIKMDIFNIILHPALEFHLTSMSYARRIGGHDRHHRSRETPEDEFEVMKACRDFEDELVELWQRRPGILNLDASQLRAFLSEDIAQGLERLFSVYMATFWAHFIYIQRVAYWSLKHSPIALKAIEETGHMMRRSVGQSDQDRSFDIVVTRTAANIIHPGLMWTCFIWGCEVADPVQQEWAVLQLRALANRELELLNNQPPDGIDAFPAYRLDQKGAQNALKASRLLERLVERQTSTKARVDGKYLSQELFGCSFYVL